MSVSLHRRGSTVGSDQPPSRRMSSYSWPSISTSKSESPNYDSHRHVGEGALDDSDSSDSDNEQKENKAEGGSSDEECGLVPAPPMIVSVKRMWTNDQRALL